MVVADNWEVVGLSLGDISGREEESRTTSRLLACMTGRRAHG